MRTVMTSKMQSVNILRVIILTVASQVTSCSALNRDGRNLRRDPCDSRQYRDVLALRDTENCIGENHVWGMLDSLYHATNGPYCMKQAIMLLSAIFNDPKHNPKYCTCTGWNTLRTHPNGFMQHTQDCANNDQLYVYLYERHFFMEHTKYYQQPPHCSSHHAVWPALASIGSDICRNDIVIQVASMFRSSGDQCSCLKKAEGNETQQPLYPANQATFSPRVPSDHCLQYQSYAYLYSLSLNVDLCVSVNNMWYYLADLHHRDIDCRKEIMDHMGAIFRDFEQSPDSCSCIRHNTQHHTVNLHNLDQSYCNRYHEEYKVLLHDEIYAQIPPPCRSHQYLWGKLLRISVGELETDCRADLILHAAATHQMTESDPCTCSHVTGSPTQSVTPTVATSATLKPTFTSTEASPVTSNSFPATNTPATNIKQVTEHLIGLHVCNNASTIFSIAHNVTVAHPGASICVTGEHSSSEALVFISCNTSSTAKWRKGEDVMELCNRIPLYTPIATFNTDGVYEPDEGMAGIFLGCLPNGFKFAAQNCNSGVQIKHLESGGMLANNASKYFVVRW